MGDEAQELFRENNELLRELEGFYHDFDEYGKNRLKTRVGQVLLLQENVLKGMQGTYFIR